MALLHFTRVVCLQVMMSSLPMAPVIGSLASATPWGSSGCNHLKCMAGVMDETRRKTGSRAAQTGSETRCLILKREGSAYGGKDTHLARRRDAFTRMLPSADVKWTKWRRKLERLVDRICRLPVRPPVAPQTQPGRRHQTPPIWHPSALG